MGCHHPNQDGQNHQPGISNISRPKYSDLPNDGMRWFRILRGFGIRPGLHRIVNGLSICYWRGYLSRFVLSCCFFLQFIWKNTGWQHLGFSLFLRLKTMVRSFLVKSTCFVGKLLMAPKFCLLENWTVKKNSHFSRSGGEMKSSCRLDPYVCKWNSHFVQSDISPRPTSFRVLPPCFLNIFHHFPPKFPSFPPNSPLFPIFPEDFRSFPRGPVGKPPWLCEAFDHGSLALAATALQLMAYRTGGETVKRWNEAGNNGGGLAGMGSWNGRISRRAFQAAKKHAHLTIIT